MGADFSLNVSLCLWIAWTNKQNPRKIQNQMDLLQDLTVCELVEFHAPLSLIMANASAFYGPNAEIFGNISNSYWKYTEIEDIQQNLANMGIFFIIDFTSAIVSGIILWSTCRINLFNVSTELQKEFRIQFFVILSNLLITVISAFE